MTTETFPTLPACLAALCAELDRFRGTISPTVLHSRLLAADVDLESLSARLRFDPHRYCRNRLHEGPGYEALLLCWRPGQASPIHDHGGSSCAFRIVTGVGTESVFSLDGDWVRAVAERTHPTGAVNSSQDGEIHELANRQARDLVTLHLYSPALGRLRTYRRAPQADSMAVA